ncbi:MAG TPA: hypothetical protein VEA69_10885 [Tepidisphaeraceae bacterium]|nr:hypothetical protein [Tepidisphaeraceae bacterium]
MVRFLRYLWGGVAALSLVLCVGAAVLWSRGHQRLDTVAIRVSETHQISAHSSRGQFCFMQMYLPAGAGGSFMFSHEPGFSSEPPQSFGDTFVLGPMGFYFKQPKFGLMVWRVAIMPAWFVVGVTAALPAVWVVRRLRRKRVAGRGFALDPAPARPDN